jgi:hypothetical protein
MRHLLLALIAGTALLCAQPAGYPSRAADLDVRPGFRTPPPGYGEVGFYWWLGDPITKERLTWHLDQLANKGVTALQVNYAHTDKGGQSWGLTFASEPPLFSEPWWDLFGWFLKQARSRGMAASLSDYTLGWAGNGWYMDEILKDHPDLRGAVLERETHECSGPCTWQPPAGTLSITARQAGATIDLRANLENGTLHWTTPAGQWSVIAVHPKVNPISLDPMHPIVGQQMIEKFFQRFEDRNPGQSGKGLNFFFSDELTFGVRGWLWNPYFAAEFKKRKGYDVVPELASLFEETGPRAVKVRLDYSDVMVSLEEENYFRPLYEWHHSRGMLYGCDHGGRGRDVTEFGDYFRTQRWMTGPGNDQPGLASDVIKNKVSSSITHLYQRERTWLEGYYGSGWGTTSAQLVDATWRNFAQGQNLLTLHGLYYSTHGGWWEWAPPDNHFRMPYWEHMGEFLHSVERMSYLLSQGFHRADIAIVYPVAAMEAGPDGQASVDTAFALGKDLYANGIDFDFMDFESLARAKVEDGKLKVAGEEYRALVLPAMRVVRHSTLQKAVELQRAGGTVIVVGAAPQASERTGDGDPEVKAMAAQLTPIASHQVIARLDANFQRDFACASPEPYVLHRKAGERDVYLVYGVPKNTLCTFRTTGYVERWDPWSGDVFPLPVSGAVSGQSTTIAMPLESTEAQLIVFRPGMPDLPSAQVSRVPASIPVSGDWEFEIKPTLDNRFGDYRLPAAPVFIGAEARRFHYQEETRMNKASGDSSQWPLTTYTYGPQFWKLGPLPATAELDPRAVDPSQPITIAGREYRWQPYEFSLRWGVEGDPGHQGYHGLKEEVPSEFIALGRQEIKPTTTNYAAEEGGTRYYLWTTVYTPKSMEARVMRGGDLPAAVWIGNSPVDPTATKVIVHAGSTPLLLRYDKPGRGYFALSDSDAPSNWQQTYPLASIWYNRPGLLPFDTRPGTRQPVGWYRTTSPPGLRSLTLVIYGSATLWVDDKEVVLPKPRSREDGSVEYVVTLAKTLAAPAKVAIRIQQERGFYAGAAFAEPLQFHCGTGSLAAGDWSRIEGLASYSGGALYRKTVTLTAEQVKRPVTLNLGQVSSSAEIRVNGQRAAVKLAPPYAADITNFVHAGENRIEVLVFSALSNHYQTIPTRYRSTGPSGLLGPVQLELR